MRVAVVIPARLGSTRLPGKMLADIGGRPLIVRTVEAARRSGYPVIVATDHSEIGARSAAAGAEVRWTPSDARNGTERVAYACDGFDAVVDWQGDSPLLSPDLPRALIAGLDGFKVASAYTDGQDPVHVELRGLRATDFRRDRPTGHHHLGVYAYTAEALRAYLSHPPTGRETEDGLEQLRWLSMGVSIAMVRTPDRKQGLEVNEASDIPRVEAALAA